LFSVFRVVTAKSVTKIAELIILIIHLQCCCYGC